MADHRRLPRPRGAVSSQQRRRIDFEEASRLGMYVGAGHHPGHPTFDAKQEPADLVRGGGRVGEDPVAVAR